MLSVRGEFHNGTATPLSKIEGQDGQQVIIIFLEGSAAQSSESATLRQNGELPIGHQAANDPLRELIAEGPEELPEDLKDDPMMKLIAACATDTGIGDLAHEHDHYLYGTPKRGDYDPQSLR